MSLWDESRRFGSSQPHQREATAESFDGLKPSSEATQSCLHAFKSGFNAEAGPQGLVPQGLVKRLISGFSKETGLRV